MFRKSYNRAVLELRVETVTPLLIRAGDAGLDPTAADLVSVRTNHGRHGLTVYIPGSSLKGVVRSAAEATVRGDTFQGVDGACDPLEHRSSCGHRGGQIRSRDYNRPEEYTAEVHRVHCLACRLFGSTAMKGRASIRDLFPFPPGCEDARELPNFRKANRLEERHAVSIDRVLGSVKNGPFDMEMVPAGVSFWGEIALENFQVWQLGLIAQALEEVNSGFAQLGSTKSRGLGVAKVEVTSITHEQSGPPSTAGVGDLCRDHEERRRYGLLMPEGGLPTLEGEVRGLSRRFRARTPEAAKAWLDRGLDTLGGLR